MAAETDKFVIATLALWAGDTDYANEQLAEYSAKHHRSLASLTILESPEELISATAVLRRRQLAMKTREFKGIVSARANDIGELTDTPLLIHNNHLRATIWRRTSRHFVMKGYLTDLEWEPRLFKLSREAAKAASSAPIQVTKPTAQRESHGPLGASWAIEGDLFIEVDVTDLGQIEANGVWTKVDMPDTAQAIVAPFQNLLNDLDRPAGTSDLVREPPMPE